MRLELLSEGGRSLIDSDQWHLFFLHLPWKRPLNGPSLLVALARIREGFPDGCKN